MALKLLGLLLLFLTPLFGGEFRFAKMENGDHLELTEVSTGCFHHTRSYYEVRKTDGLVHFAVFDVVWGKEGGGKITKKTLRGELELGRKDVQGLDKLLEFYRSKKEVFSTTQVSLRLVHYKGGRKTGSEKLLDESGGHDLEKRPEVLTMWALNERLKNAGK